jgi:hypothetical protein
MNDAEELGCGCGLLLALALCAYLVGLYVAR